MLAAYIPLEWVSHTLTESFLDADLYTPLSIILYSILKDLLSSNRVVMGIATIYLRVLRYNNGICLLKITYSICAYVAMRCSLTFYNPFHSPCIHNKWRLELTRVSRVALCEWVREDRSGSVSIIVTQTPRSSRLSLLELFAFILTHVDRDISY